MLGIGIDIDLVVTSYYHWLSTSRKGTFHQTMESTPQFAGKVRRVVCSLTARRRYGLHFVEHQVPDEANRTCHLRPIILENPTIKLS